MQSPMSEADRPARARAVAGIVLAAGRSARMAPRNKLLLELDGAPLVRRVADAALGAGAAPVVVVTGHDRADVERALAGLPVQLAHNPRYADGLARSLETGIRALPQAVGGALILLGDMPRIAARHLRLLLRAFAPEQGAGVCVPVWQQRRGNPVLWGARYFPELLELTGDRGARGLLDRHAAALREVAMPDDAVLVDVDGPEAFARLAARHD
jgi:molybdenum cofactor cytidylyltransferase